MTDLRTAEAGVEFLERLLERSERHPDRSRPASAAPEYDKLSTAQQVGRFHDLMAPAERFGAVEVQLEMITRNPLEVPCLTDKYWATFPDRNGRYLADTLRLVRDATGRLQHLPHVDGECGQVFPDEVARALSGRAHRHGARRCRLA